MAQPEEKPPVWKKKRVSGPSAAPFVPGGGTVADYLAGFGQGPVFKEEKTLRLVQLAARQIDQILKTVPPGEKELVSAAMACKCVTAQRHTIGRDKALTALKSLSEHLDGEVVRVERARDEHALRWGGRQGGAR